MSDGTQSTRNSCPNTASSLNQTFACGPVDPGFSGLHGKKNRRVVNGRKNATPAPYVESASKNPCEAVAREIPSHARHRSGRPTTGSRIVHVAAAPSATAKINEWVRPRCESQWSYGIRPKLQSQSTSGSAAQTAAQTQYRRVGFRGANGEALPRPATACEKEEGNGS
jgi:hypothetical protein